MKLGEFHSYLGKLLKENPTWKDIDVIYSADEEGNRYSPVVYHPTPGIFGHGEFDTIPPKGDKSKVNSICVN